MIITDPDTRLLPLRQERSMCTGIRAPNNSNVSMAAPPWPISRLAAACCHISSLEIFFCQSATSQLAPVKNRTVTAA